MRMLHAPVCARSVMNRYAGGPAVPGYVTSIGGATARRDCRAARIGARESIAHIDEISRRGFGKCPVERVAAVVQHEQSTVFDL